MTHRTIDDLDHEELATLVKEHLLGGHLIDRAGMPFVTRHGVDVMRDIAIDEWMGASPIYTKRTQRLLDFEGDTVEACFKSMQLEIGAPPEFMDFRYTVIDDHHGLFHLDHCGALMDVEPMGEEFVVGMCHEIEDPTFDATAWATNPRMRMRPIHRPPRTPADRHPHCAWEVTIDESFEPTPEPPQLARIAASRAAGLPLTPIEWTDENGVGDTDDTAGTGADSSDDKPTDVNRTGSNQAGGNRIRGMADYTKPLDADLQVRDFAPPVLRAFDEEACLQGQLLSMSFMAAVEDRFGPDEAAAAGAYQLTGVAGAVAERLHRAFELGTEADDVATVFSLHPAFRPAAYVDWRVTVEGDEVHLELGDCPAREEDLLTWASLLADGNDRPLSAIATAVDPHWSVRSDGPHRWTVERSDEATAEPAEVTVTKFSTGMAFGFDR